MTSSSRRILVFVAAGLLCAVAVGVAVWRMSAPESVVSKPSAATAVPRTASSAPSTTHSYTTTAAPTSTQSKQSKTNVAAPAEDPYLAPNAVVNRTEPTADPGAAGNPQQSVPAGAGQHGPCRAANGRLYSGLRNTDSGYSSAKLRAHSAVGHAGISDRRTARGPSGGPGRQPAR